MLSEALRSSSVAACSTISACRHNRYTSARPPSANAFCVNSMLRTAGCTMIGSASFSGTFGPERERIARRSFAYASAPWNEPSDAARP